MLAARDWFSDPATQWLLGRFPRPLVVVAEDGAVEFANDAFTRRFERSCLKDPAMVAILAGAEGQHRAVPLDDRDGVRRSVDVQAIAVEGAAILVLDVSGEGAIAGELDQMRARIRELELTSATDRLTGAWNRAHLDAVIPNEIARSSRYRLPLSLVLIDIDHFKRVNDTYGHAAGDDVLRDLVRVVKGAIRSADLCFRWGGEEFVILATSTGYRAAATLAETVRARIEAHAFPTVGRVTASMGIAEHTGAESAEAWFKRVDAALYLAKRDGRNCVRVDRVGDSDRWSSEGNGALQLTWSEAYACGNATIDHEHEELFFLANKVIAASSAGDSSSKRLIGALDVLVEHLGAHFVDEEAILAARGYEQLERHRHIHAALLERAGALQASALTGSSGFGELVDFLANTVVSQHMLSEDRAFFPLFRDGAHHAP